MTGRGGDLKHVAFRNGRGLRDLNQHSICRRLCDSGRCAKNQSQSASAEERGTVFHADETPQPASGFPLTLTLL